MSDTLRLPWKVEDGKLFNSAGFPIETVTERTFIIRAVNNHDALIKALSNLHRNIAATSNIGWDADTEQAIEAADALIAALEAPE